MMDHKDDVVETLTKGIEGLFKKNKVDYVVGHGAIDGPGKVKVALGDGGEQVLQAKSIVIATGSESTPLPGVEVDEERIVTSTGALELEAVPEHLRGHRRRLYRPRDGRRLAPPRQQGHGRRVSRQDHARHGRRGEQAVPAHPGQAGH